MSRPRKARIYKRGNRYYGDFRGFGGGREPLVPDGHKPATTDRDVAEYLAAARVAELETHRQRRAGHLVPAMLAPFAAHHLVKKAQSGKIDRQWLKVTETYLRRAIEFFGDDRELDQILPKDVEAWAGALSELAGGRGGNEKLSPATIRHHLNTMSNLFKRAIADQRVPAGHNPVAAMLDKPTGAAKEARWLEVHEAALLLEAARCYRPAREERTLPYAHALIATFLLTGGRESEVLGLEVDDVSLHRKTVTFRPNDRRKLKTKKSHRPVPLWPQLETLLRDHMAERERNGGSGLYCSRRFTPAMG